MDLGIKDKLFIVTGASAGLGNGVAKALLNENAKIIAIAREPGKLNELAKSFPRRVEQVAGDVTQSETIGKIVKQLNGRNLAGLLVNAGGPPAKSFLETDLTDWDTAYQCLLRWKVGLTKALLPVFRQQKYGRIVYVESD